MEGRKGGDRRKEGKGLIGTKVDGRKVMEKVSHLHPWISGRPRPFLQASARTSQNRTLTEEGTNEDREGKAGRKE